METCTVETGLLRKTPCGQTGVAKCANCERALCSKHAIAQLSASGHKTGAFLCADCNAAQKLYEKTEAARASHAALKPPPEKPRAALPPKPPADAPAAAGKPAQENSDGSIDFTPT